MGVGESLLGLFGSKDPRTALLQSVMQQDAAATGAPYATTPAPAGGASAPAAADAASAQPSALQTPPDLSAMYQDLVKYDQRASNINRGFGLIGSAISQDANRGDTLRAFVGDRPETDRIGINEIATVASNLNKARLAAQIRAAQLAALPAVAKRYGIDMETARYLMESGKLDEIAANAEKPNFATPTDANGQIRPLVQTGVGGLTEQGVIGPAKPEETTTSQDAQGRTITTSKVTGQQVGPAVGPIKPLILDGPDGSKFIALDPADPSAGTKQLIPPGLATNDTKNYQSYVDDEITRGTDPDKILSFNDWGLQQKKAGTARAESAEQAGIGTYRGTQYGKIQDAANAAQDNLNNYNLIEKGLDTGVATGTFGESEQNLRKMAQYWGWGDPSDDKIAGAELIQKISGRMQLAMRNPESGLGMPGSLSDKDMAFLKDSNIGLSTSGQGNRLTLEVFRRLDQRKIQRAEMMDDFMSKHDGSTAGFNKYWRDYTAKNDLFGDLKVEDFGPKASSGDDQTDALVNKWTKKK